MKHRKWTAPIALAILVAACAPAATPPPSPSPEPVSIPSAEPIDTLGLRPGSAAPDLTLKTLDGGQVSLSDYKGRPVFINFWASWCGPCRAEMPEIIAAYNAHKDSGLEVLAINSTQLDVVDDARAFVDEFQMPFPVLLDEEGSANKAFSVIGLPTSVFIDAGGLVQAVNIGPMTGEIIEEHLKQILPSQ